MRLRGSARASRSWRGVAAVAASVALTAGVLHLGVASAATTPTYTPRLGAIFNDPTGDHSQQYAIQNEILKAINATPAGADLTGAVYTLTNNDIGDALVSAHKRGVNVRMVIDEHYPDSETAALTKELGGNLGASSWFEMCDNGCMSDDSNAIMHAKIFMFSQTGNAKYVSIVGSSNMTTTNAEASWNNAFIYQGNTDIYGSLKQYVYDMSKDKNAQNYDKYVASYSSQMWMYPTATEKPDTLSELEKVSCSGATGGTGVNGHTLVRIDNNSWTSGRLDVAKKVASLKSQGCVVEVIVNATDGIDSDVLKELKNVDIPIYNANVKDGGTSLYTHDKVMTISGNFDGKTNAKTIYTGSLTWSNAATDYANNILLRINNGPTYDAYSAHFEKIRDHWTKKIN